mmetsp:Transcript_10133/g.23411  ORF Transcript_10133/g.23411 Transcript_10133/m.23411 type:complete len:252 (-) Transcript_10133:862-1617(-)
MTGSRAGASWERKRIISWFSRGTRPSRSFEASSESIQKAPAPAMIEGVPACCALGSALGARCPTRVLSTSGSAGSSDEGSRTDTIRWTTTMNLLRSVGWPGRAARAAVAACRMSRKHGWRWGRGLEEPFEAELSSTKIDASSSPGQAAQAGPISGAPAALSKRCEAERALASWASNGATSASRCAACASAGMQLEQRLRSILASSSNCALSEAAKTNPPDSKASSLTPVRRLGAKGAMSPGPRWRTRLLRR